MPKIHITYVTSNPFKEEEIRLFTNSRKLEDGTAAVARFEFDFWPLDIKEVLEVDIVELVKAEVKNAYSHIRVPCVVEHAGLVFADFQSESYPGGLTKAMWNALGDQFVQETHSANRCAIARAVVAYCDGMEVRTFKGETMGRIASSPRGSRRFYWDTVFEPFDLDGKANGKTYAEIVDDPELGLPYKVNCLSQSSKAFAALLEYLHAAPEPKLWGKYP